MYLRENGTSRRHWALLPRWYNVWVTLFPVSYPETVHRDPIRLAPEINHFEKLIAIALSPSDQDCARYNCSNSIRAKRRRHRVIIHLEKLGELLRPLQQLPRELPVSEHARRLSIPLICALATQLNYADKTLTSDLARGAPIVGEIPRTTALHAKDTLAYVRLHDAQGSSGVTNGKVLKSLSGSIDAILKPKWWDLSWAEFRKGWLSEPAPAPNSDLRDTILSPRFCISEHHGVQEPKFRLIDDLAKSNVDKTVQMSETYCPQSPDSSVALTRLQNIDGADGLKQWSVDFPRAYKTIALHPSSSEDAYISFLNTIDNRPYKSRILAQPFGSCRAPANWVRVATFLQFLARVLLSLAVGAYVEDVYCSESNYSAKSGFWDFKRMCSLLGPNASGSKDQPHSAAMHLLGAEVALLKNAIRTRATDDRERKLRGHIAQALYTNFLTPAAASKLRGRLGFPASLLMGVLRRGMTGPLIRRHYGSNAYLLSSELKRNLPWRHNAIGALPPRSIPLTLLTPMGSQCCALVRSWTLPRRCPIATTVRYLRRDTHLPHWFV